MSTDLIVTEACFITDSQSVISDNFNIQLYDSERTTKSFIESEKIGIIPFAKYDDNLVGVATLFTELSFLKRKPYLLHIKA